MHALKWFIFALCIIVPLPSFASDDLESMDLPIVLTASRMRQPLAEAPAAVTVIDRDMIERSGVRQIADLLRFVPGAVVGYNDGNWPVATPLRQNSCRPDMILNLGAIRDNDGTVRRSIQEQSDCAVVAAG
ncbi:MAG: TonB-dependent receptor plug domain-containing protein, partial [Georgfuchsia sp.]